MHTRCFLLIFLAFCAYVAFGVLLRVTILSTSMAQSALLVFLVAPILVEAFSTSGTFAFVAALEAYQSVFPLFVIFHHVLVKHSDTHLAFAFLTVVLGGVATTVAQRRACCAHQPSFTHMVFA